MVYDFGRPVDRRDTNDLKWRPEGLKGYLPIQVSGDMIPMWIADMDLPCPACVAQAIRRRAETEVFGYCGLRPGYFQAVSWWYKERFGLELKEEAMSVLPTVVSAINMGIRAFSEPGDQVIIQQPVYEPFAGLIARTGREMVNNALICEAGRYRMDYDLLEKQAADPRAKVLVLCSPHNPVGRVWSGEELRRLGDICQRHGVFVIADEIHSDIVFSGHTHIPFPLASGARHMLCTAPSKTFNVAGLREANVFLPDPEDKKRFDQVTASYSMSGTNTFGLEAVEAAYSPEGEEWLKQLLTYLEGNAELVDQWAKANGIPFVKPEGTFLCWLDLSAAGLDDAAIQEKVLVGKEVICVPGPWFGPGGEGHLRLNIGCTRATLAEAMSRIRQAL